MISCCYYNNLPAIPTDQTWFWTIQKLQDVVCKTPFGRSHLHSAALLWFDSYGTCIEPMSERYGNHWWSTLDLDRWSFQDFNSNPLRVDVKTRWMVVDVDWRLERYYPIYGSKQPPSTRFPIRLWKDLWEVWTIELCIIGTVNLASEGLWKVGNEFILTNCFTRNTQAALKFWKTKSITFEQKVKLSISLTWYSKTVRPSNKTYLESTHFLLFFPRYACCLSWTLWVLHECLHLLVDPEPLRLASFGISSWIVAGRDVDTFEDLWECEHAKRHNEFLPLSQGVICMSLSLFWHTWPLFGKDLLVARFTPHSLWQMTSKVYSPQKPSCKDRCGVWKWESGPPAKPRDPKRKILNPQKRSWMEDDFRFPREDGFQVPCFIFFSGKNVTNHIIFFPSEVALDFR